MSGDLPQLTKREVLQAIDRAGWHRGRKKGDHIILKREDGTGRVSIPDYRGDLRPGTVRSILKQAGLTVAQFNQLRRGFTMPRYTVLLLPDSTLGGYTVEVPSLPGVVTEGDTREQALANAQEAIELFLEDVLADGEAVPIESDGGPPELATVDVNLPKVAVDDTRTLAESPRA